MRRTHTEPGAHFAPEVRNIIRLTMAFAEAVGANQQDAGDNLIVSPYNHLRFLSMIAKGAAGTMREEMAQVLFNADEARLDDEIAKLITLNQTILDANKDKVTLKTATAFWVNSDFARLKDTYARSMEQLFSSLITNKSFAANPNLAADANTWASDNTKEKPTDEKGLITHIADKFDGDMAAFLASALYFKGMWTNKFDPKLTDLNKKFTSDGGEEFFTPIMHREFAEGQVTYQQDDDYEAIALTYAEKNPRERKYPSMRIVLVRPTDAAMSARNWMAAQAAGGVPAWLDPYQFEDARGIVELPRMDMKQRHNLIPPLQQVGLKTLFTPAANFSNMIESGRALEFSECKEDIVFETDENGSTGASIVSGGIRATSVQAPPRRINIHFDRSFVFAVQDIATGTVIFTGAVNKPNKDMRPVPAPAAG